MWRRPARIVLITLALVLAATMGTTTAMLLATRGPRPPLRVEGSVPAPSPIASSPAPRPAAAASPQAAVRLPSPAVPSPSPSPVLTLVWDETFATNELGWPDDPDSTAWLAADGYHLATRNPGHFVAVAPAERLGLSAVQVTATFRKVGGMPGGSYGIIVHDQGRGPRDGLNQTGDFDVLEARDTGQVSIWRNEADRRVELVPWRASSAVRVGTEENQLLVRATGTQLLLLVNGVEAARSVDPTLDSGAVGVFVGGESNEVVLRRVVVEALS